LVYTLKDKKPLIIGHRGAPRQAPENTLASFGLALKQGCGGIELDVHLSLDGKVLVCHDSSIDRTTNGTGTIRHMLAEEVRQFDAGSWFSKKYAGEKVPLLEEVFRLVPGHILINIEVKQSYGGEMERALIHDLWQHNRFHNVVISSYDHACLRLLKRLEPKVKAGLLSANFLDYMQDIEMLNIDLYSLHPFHLLVTSEDVNTVSSAGIKVFPYTVDSVIELKKLAGYGVAGVITNDPASLRNYVKKRYRK
jgi:glycerophosphoryl diester phosphodiesterase